MQIIVCGKNDSETHLWSPGLCVQHFDGGGGVGGWGRKYFIKGVELKASSLPLSMVYSIDETESTQGKGEANNISQQMLGYSI